MHALALNEMNGVLSSYNSHSGETRRWRQTSSIPRLPGKWQASLLYSKTRFKRHPTLISLINCARVIGRWRLLLHTRKAVRWLASSCYVVTSMHWLWTESYFDGERPHGWQTVIGFSLSVYISESSDNFWLTFVILISLVEELGTRLSARSMTNATLKTGNDYCVPFAMMCNIAHTRVFLSSRSQCVETGS